MYAIIETGGKQYRVQEGDILEVERLAADVNAEIEIGRVLALNKDGSLQVGQPVVDGAKAVGRVLEHGRGDKIRIFKYKAKTSYRRRMGHRQAFTRVKIERIEG